MTESTRKPRKRLAKTLSVVFMEIEGHWIAQAMEHDICAQGKSLLAVKAEFERIVCLHIERSVQRKEEPFERYGPAPSSVLEIIEKSWELAATSSPNQGTTSSGSLDYRGYVYPGSMESVNNGLQYERRLQQNGKPYPRQRWIVQMELQGDSERDIISILRNFLFDAESGQTSWQVVGGGKIVTCDVNDQFTPERFQADLDAYEISEDVPDDKEAGA